MKVNILGMKLIALEISFEPIPIHFKISLLHYILETKKNCDHYF